MIQGIERILKAAIVDKTPSVSSAALVSSYHLFNASKDIIKRWSNEVQEAVNTKSSGGLGFASAASSYFGSGSQGSQNQTVISTSDIYQYHAIGLLYLIRQQDRMAVTKLVQTFSGTRSAGGFLSGGSSTNVLKNPSAVCMLIRFASKVIEDDPSATRRIYELLEGFLRHKSDMVNLEAARAICEMPNISDKELHLATSVLQLFLSSPKPTLRFAAIRTLNKLSINNPAAVTSCNLDIETLISDSNRSIATFAITTLLKTGNEASVDRLMKQISGFMNDISDEFKVIVVEAIRSLCLKFPAKQAVMMSFLSNVLRDEGGYNFKKAVVEAIFDIVKHIPESKDMALSHLCEFIEDCEFTKLSVRVLHLLGIEGPKAVTPTKYIRYIYNRVILENSIIRAAAVSALAKFGINGRDEEIRKSVHVLLSRCLDDVDDEVRDRAALYLSMMDNQGLAKRYVTDDSTYALPSLERQLVEYISNPLGITSGFKLESIPIISKLQEEQERRRNRPNDSAILPLLTVPSNKSVPAATSPGVGTPISGNNIFTSSLDQQAMYAEKLAAIPEFTSFGVLFKSSSKPIDLTESETEYIVQCVKHTFAKHVVFQFICTNTLNDQLLENVHMVMQPEIEGLAQVVEIPAERLEYNVPGTIYVAFEQEDPEELANVTFTNTLKFEVKDCDPTTGEADPEGFEDEYQVEDIEVVTSDYVRSSYVPDFAEEFKSLQDNEVIDTFALDKEKAHNLQDACDSIIDLLGMQPLEGTESPKNNSVHTLLLSGTFLDGSKVLAKCRMTFNTSSGVAFELAVRSEDVNVSQIIILAIS
ncbi:hypothetical protein G6F35_006041 [Rhizopus arrhizus]|nr:hypothetical protein G6F35_006041 [Rhizopus arrhizus]